MKSDALFYELFQTAPQIFFELMQIDPPCPYRFESLTVKTTEKRIDGIFEPEQIRSDLPTETEQRLLTLLAQLIEERFKTLTYKELSQMLQLTPLRETTSGQELIQDDRIEMLTKLIRYKFSFAESTMEKLNIRLRQLSLEDLEALFRAILDVNTLQE